MDLSRHPTLRAATTADLDAVNRVIDAAVSAWRLPERVKRLALPSYRYTLADLTHLQMMVAVTADGTIVGVAACEPADPKDAPGGVKALLLHGIYVSPQAQRQGVGRQLFAAVQRLVHELDLDGLLVKAQPEARGFFLAQGMSALPSRNHRDYAHRFWKAVDAMTQ